MAHPTVAAQLVEMLRDAGVERIYGVVGDSLNPVVDAVRHTAGIEWVHVSNEEGGAFAAAAEAQVTGKLAVCAGSCGPGNTHLLQGLFDAHRSGAPVLAIASHIQSQEIGMAFFQETHPERMFQECSYWCEVMTPKQMPHALRVAVQTAVGKRGVSVVVLPGDLAAEESGGPTVPTAMVTTPSPVRPAAGQVQALADAINAARTVTLFCGAGCAGAHDEVMELAGTVLSPVGHALGGKEVIQYDNPYDVGMNGLLGYGAAHKATHEADLLVLLGTDFPYTNFLPQARTAQVDADASHLGRRTPLEVAVHGDVGETIRALLPLLERKTDRTFLDAMLRDHAHALEKVVDAYTRKVEKMRPIHPEYVAAQLDELAADDAVFTVDTGMCNVWAARYLSPNGRRRVIGSFRHGSMANALPHAVGAQFADRGRQVVSMSGDGGLAMLLGELITVRLHRLPVKIVLFNNASLGMVKLEMMVDGIPDFETDHEPTDFAAIAAGVGIPSYRVEDPAQVRETLVRGLAEPGPVLMEFVTDANALSIPPAITGEQVRGFATTATKMVLGGGVGKMVDLARANLRNVPRP
ncbi:pyruvate dehydrogenase/oxidase: FAD-and thiamine PPi-binding [Modestobacter italicus]|uniref:Pyruvate dehydrogenase/oxidase: FAD-and thiamine PPi-binding n=1 Tax=Modestobacter italicus (strain DSM 44449 / CECT 9708 / BC 501) TaxID=2732864 RepID=I4EVY2_MODI5|nr:pyruvate dehydrogenase [Modestobacter marinus]CCH87545.1 pyruvate dehydrogenase/oxidase: FAD-and thiamine PPi-binding [Modestobacter marinus]